MEYNLLDLLLRYSTFLEDRLIFTYESSRHDVHKITTGTTDKIAYITNDYVHTSRYYPQLRYLHQFLHGLSTNQGLLPFFFLEKRLDQGWMFVFSFHKFWWASSETSQHWLHSTCDAPLALPYAMAPLLHPTRQYHNGNARNGTKGCIFLLFKKVGH